MHGNHVRKLVAGKCTFPRIIERIHAGEPELPLLQKPHEPRKTKIPPYFAIFGNCGHRDASYFWAAIFMMTSLKLSPGPRSERSRSIMLGSSQAIGARAVLNRAA